MRAPCVRGGAARRGASMQGDGRSAAAASHLLAHAGELAARAGCDAVLEVVEQAEAVVLHREHPLAAGGRRVHRSPTLEAPGRSALGAAMGLSDCHIMQLNPH